MKVLFLAYKVENYQIWLGWRQALVIYISPPGLTSFLHHILRSFLPASWPDILVLLLPILRFFVPYVLRSLRPSLLRSLRPSLLRSLRPSLLTFSINCTAERLIPPSEYHS